MSERPVHHVRPTNLHYRGEFLQPKQIVEPAVPAFLPPLTQDSRRDRLGFAQWLVSANNPLTRPRGRQSAVASVLWPRPGPHVGRFWNPR